MFVRIPPNVWVFEGVDAERKDILNTAILPEELIDCAINQARVNQISIRGEPCYSDESFWRVAAELDIDKDLFDLIFHGPSGYRAQYYHSENCGEAYNRKFVQQLIPTLLNHCSSTDRRLYEASFRGEYSKITWYENDWLYYQNPIILKAARWVSYYENHPSECPMGLKDFSLSSTRLFVKGTFLDSKEPSVVLPPTKPRAKRIHEFGWS